MKPFFTILLFSCLFLQSCVEDTFEQDRALRVAVDTLYENEISRLNPILDSLCALRMETEVAKVTDSLIAVRKKAVQETIDRLKKFNPK